MSTIDFHLREFPDYSAEKENPTRDQFLTEFKRQKGALRVEGNREDEVIRFFKAQCWRKGNYA